ncbi:MAG: hypothetical protein ACYTG2_13010 [Planctomycetota bacterium]|jgi:hypothetical protein
MIPRHLAASLVLALALGAASAPAHAGIGVIVTVKGEVEWNLINNGTLSVVQVGEQVTMSFRVDSETYTDNMSFPVRGYHVNQNSFQLAFDSVTVGLQSPFPGGQTPYFQVRYNDPVDDGFVLSTSLDAPVGVPISVTGGFGQLKDAFHVTYSGDKLSSLAILDALGTYDFTGLSVFNWTIDDGPANPMGIIFEDLTIALAPSSWSDQGFALAGVDGDPRLLGGGSLLPGSSNTVALDHAAPSALAAAFYGFAGAPVAFKGGMLVPNPFLGPIFAATGPTGALPISFTMPPGAPSGTQLWVQWAIQDTAATAGVALSNAIRGLVP